MQPRKLQQQSVAHLGMGKQRKVEFCFEYLICVVSTDFPSGSAVQNPPVMQETRGGGSIPGSGRSAGGGHGNSLQCSSLENPMDRGTWRVTVLGVAEWDTSEQLSRHAHIPKK